MSCRASLPCLLLLTAGLTACGPVEEKAGPPGGAAFVAPPPETRRNTDPDPEVHRWLEASTSVRAQLATLRSELAGLQQIHVENHFDDFLSLDPATLDPGQLCYLQHFLERGYFRIEREVLLRILETRRLRTGTPTPAPVPPGSGISGRLQAALSRDESQLIDLETAISRYKAPGDEPFQIPGILTEPELEALRGRVGGLLQDERRKVADLDAQILRLRQTGE